MIPLSPCSFSGLPMKGLQLCASSGCTELDHYCQGPLSLPPGLAEGLIQARRPGQSCAATCVQWGYKPELFRYINWPKQPRGRPRRKFEDFYKVEGEHWIWPEGVKFFVKGLPKNPRRVALHRTGLPDMVCPKSKCGEKNCIRPEHQMDRAGFRGKK